MSHPIACLFSVLMVCSAAACPSDTPNQPPTSAEDIEADAPVADVQVQADSVDTASTDLPGSDGSAIQDADPETRAEVDVGPPPTDSGPTDASSFDLVLGEETSDAVVDATGDTTASDANGAGDAQPDDAVLSDASDAQTEIGDDATDGGTTPVFQPQCDLVVNGGAEQGLAGWTIIEGEFEAKGQGFGSPSPTSGSNHFFAGEAAVSLLVQDIDVSSFAEAIDAGGVWVHLDANVRNWSGDDEASLLLWARDASGAQLGEAQGGPWLAESWTARQTHLLLPSGTRVVRVGLRGKRNNGVDNDAYFDEVRLCIDTVEPTAEVNELLAPPYLMWVTHEAVTVFWETAAPTVGVVQYGTDPDNLDGAVAEGAAATTHEVRLQGLPPNSLIHYRLSWGEGYSETFSFHTAPAPDSPSNEPFTFLMWADNQNGPDNFTDLIPHMLAENAKFAISAGDCVQNGTRSEYRSQLFVPISPLARHVPFLVASGNHELYSDPGAALFEEYFAQPGDEHCFGWRWGPLYIQFIDTERPIDPGSAQHTCITEGLNSPEAQSATYRAAIFHKPPRIEYWFGGVLAFTNAMEAPWVREELEPLLETLDVDIVFNGHNHLYAYTPKTLGGITWVTSGGAGGGLDTDNLLWKVGDWPEIAEQIHAHHFLSVDVAGDLMTVTAIGFEGEVLTSFTLSP